MEELFIGLASKALETGNAFTSAVVIYWLGKLAYGKYRKNGNNVPRRRIEDRVPGNPGHSNYEILTDRMDRLEHRLEDHETKTFELGQAIARIEGRLDKP